MMKLAIFRRSKFGFQKWDILRYSTTATSTDSLSWQLSPVRIPEGSIIPVLDQWVKQRRDVEKHDLRNAITMLREHDLFDRALEVCEWMSDRRCMKLDEHDVAARLDLIFQVYGTEKAESFFNNIAPEFKGMETYNALLNCYIRSNSVEKVEATVQKMKESGFERSKSSYSSRLSLYRTTGEKDKVEALSREMKELGFWTEEDTTGMKSEELVDSRLKAEVEKAENHFNSIAPSRRDWKAYVMLLNSYAKSNLVEKAEATVQRMKGEGLMKKASSCNAVLNLYCQTGDTVKFNAIVGEMEENGVKFNKVALGTMLTAYAKASDIGGMNKTLQLIESNPKAVPDWTSYFNAADAFVKAGDTEKALAMLKKSEEQVVAVAVKSRGTVYNSFLSLYAALGRKDDVLRVWEVCHKEMQREDYSTILSLLLQLDYSTVVSLLLKLDDLEAAVPIAIEWSYSDQTYDMDMMDRLASALFKKGLVETAKDFIRRARQLYNNHDPLESGCLAACLELKKHEGDVEEAGRYLQKVVSRGVISADCHDRLLSYVKDSKSPQNQSALDIIKQQGGLVHVGIWVCNWDLKYWIMSEFSD